MHSSITPNGQQDGAKKGDSLATDEEYRKREAILETKRQEIISRYAPYIDEPPPFISYWSFFRVIFIALMIVFALFSPGAFFPILIISTTGALIISQIIKATNDKRVDSIRYWHDYSGPRALVRKESELAAVDDEIRALRDSLSKKNQLPVTDELLLTKAKSSQNTNPRATISENNNIQVKDAGRPSEPVVACQASALAYPILGQPEHIQRLRLAELMSIPWRERTNEQMDELIEIDIGLGKANRARETNL